MKSEKYKAGACVISNPYSSRLTYLSLYHIILNLESSLAERCLDHQLAVSLIGRENPHDLVADRHGITFIRFENSKENDRDKEKVAAIRKINISFNPLQKPRALDGLCQVDMLCIIVIQ